MQDQPVANDVWQGDHGAGRRSAWQGAACALQRLGPHPLAQGKSSANTPFSLPNHFTRTSSISPTCNTSSTCVCVQVYDVCIGGVYIITFSTCVCVVYGVCIGGVYFCSHAKYLTLSSNALGPRQILFCFSCGISYAHAVHKLFSFLWRTCSLGYDTGEEAHEPCILIDTDCQSVRIGRLGRD